jgi:hypothetical protein
MSDLFVEIMNFPTREALEIIAKDALKLLILFLAA